MASHQLRTPLTSVKGYLSMVLEGDAGKITKMQRQLLREAFTSSERMVHLINDFLNVSRVQTGKFMIDRQDVDLGKVVKQEVKSLETVAESRDLRLKLEVPTQPVIVSLDEGKIRQVIMNFIDNALFYSKPNTDIKITLRLFPKEVRFEVADRGIGVPVHQQARLFSKFFRADNARTQRPDGTGVGLYLAKKVIDGHEGKLIFASKEGVGSTFGFSLPLKQADNTDDN
jgi:signal transduction histidine kinase